jgi:hypothetical protein
MRKINLLFFILFITIISNAQIAKNRFLLGGNVDYYEIRDIDQGISEAKSHSAGFSIDMGKAFKENTVLGLRASYYGWNETFVNNGVDTIPEDYNNIYGVGVFYRKYKPIWKALYFFGQADAAYSYGKAKGFYYAPPNPISTRRQSGHISFNPGISYQLFRKLQASITLPNFIAIQYDDIKRRSLSQNSNSNRFSFSTAFQNNLVDNLGLGFHLVL